MREEVIMSNTPTEPVDPDKVPVVETIPAEPEPEPEPEEDADDE